MNEGEQALVRRVLLGALALSAVAAPTTFAATPAPVAGGWAVLHTSVLATLVVALWRRWVTATFSAAAAGLIAGVSAFVLARAAAALVAAGGAPEAGLAMITLPAVLGAGGVVFLAVRSRLAIAIGLVVLLSQVGAIVLGAGAAWRTVLLAQPVVIALRFGVIAVVLFGLVSAIAERRGTERDAAAVAHELAAGRADIQRERAALRDRVLAEAAHELQNPLTVIRGTLELLLRNEELPAEQRGLVEDALWRGLDRLEERMRSVVRVGVEQDHGHDGEQTGEPQPPRSLALVVAEALESCPRAVVERVVLDVPAVLVAVPQPEADHVLENLLSNADKYGPRDQPIRVSADVVDDHVRLVVHDAGTTLREEEASHVFERGYRAGSNRALADGSGVGLSLVARLVAGWGGTVGCDVAADGTRLWVTVPLATDDGSG